jgi:hypothetical chaperone protein
MDFGTTNSGMAVYDGRTVTVLPLDPLNANPRVLRTALYITSEQALHIGRAAVDLYYEQNIGRLVKTQKVWIGEIEVYADEVYFIDDAYAWIDVSEPGRLLLSIKSRLREEDHPGAVIGQNYYSLEDLIALYLTKTRVRAEQLLGSEIREVVLGRPVHFSHDEEHDRLAQGRLLRAAFRAGYEKVYLQFEPVAAALSYETTLTQPQNVLVFDFGGGTLDITVIRLGDPGRREVLSTGGLPVAGDVFDRKLTRAKLPRHFGEGSYYGNRQDAKTTPRWIYDAFSDWQTIIELQSQENKRILQDIARTAQRRYQIEALLSLVSSNYGLKMFDEVEQSKRQLSEKRGAEIRLDGPGFEVREFITRTEFERIIQSDILAIEAELQRTLAASGLAAAEIDAVIRTGGSAQIPAFYEMLCHHFGADKVRTVDTFSSVTAGLGVYAHQIEQGEVEARAYTADDVIAPPQARGSRPRMNRVNLPLLQKRILMDEGAAPNAAAVDQVLVVLGDAWGLTAVPLPHEELAAGAPLSTSELGLAGSARQALIAAADEQLLLVTSQYRFLLVSPRQLLDMQGMSMALPDLHRPLERETLSALASWDQIKKAERLLLVTSTGFCRAYPLGVLQGSIEAPVPFRLDNALPGTAVSIIGVDEQDEFLMLTNEGRGLRWAVDKLRISGTQVLNPGKEDRVRAALAVKPDDTVTLVTADGYGRRLDPSGLEIPDQPNQKARSLIARRSPLAGAVNGAALALTSQRLLPLKADEIPLHNSTRTVPVLRPDSGEQVETLLPLP